MWVRSGGGRGGVCYFFISSASSLPRISFSSFWTSTSRKFLFEGWRSIFARTCSFTELYCWNSERMVSNSWEETSLLFKALESNLLIESRLATASVVISWCFFYFQIKSFCWRLSAPKKWERNSPQHRLKEQWLADQQLTEWSQN